MFYVAIVGQGNGWQPGYARVTETLCRNNVALRFIAIEKAMHERKTKPGVHDNTGALRLGAHDKGILSRHRFLYRDRLLTSKKKIIRDPLGLGGHNMVSEPRFINT